MITKKEIKTLGSLSIRKHRRKNGLFLFEGVRIISEAIAAKTPHIQIYVTESFLKNPKQSRFMQTIKKASPDFKIIKDGIINKISGTVTPSGIIATCPIPTQKTADFSKKSNWIYLDQIRDPGNLGTILRASAWFGITNVALSPDCADPYCPKTVRAGMGSHFCLSIIRDINLIEYKNKNFTIIGADQNSIPYSEDMINRKNPWVLVLGSESHGISPKNYSLLTHTVSITKIGTGESLNMAIAGGILLHQLTLFSNKKEKS